MRSVSVCVGFGFVVAVALGVLAGCSSQPQECHPPQFRDDQGRCVIDCVDAPGAVCDPDSGVVVGVRDASDHDASGATDVSDVTDVWDGATFDAGLACDGGLACGGTCVDEETDPMHCGSCTHACSAPSGAHPTCAGASCAFDCDPGFERVGAGCDVVVPRQIAPLSTLRVTSHTPTLRWLLPTDVDGATVEICGDRAFTRRCQTVDAAGTSTSPTSPLTPGVWFWRVHGRAGGVVGTRTGPIWQFELGVLDVSDGVLGGFVDVNADGYEDVLIGAPNTLPKGTVTVLLGAESASQMNSFPLATPAESRSFGLTVEGIGDVDGDGFGDVAVPTSATTDGLGLVAIYQGGVAPSETPAAVLRGTIDGGAFGNSVAGDVDVDGDGYGDLLVGAPDEPDGGTVYVFRGSSDGLRFTADVIVPAPMSIQHFGDRVRAATSNATGTIAVVSAPDSNVGGSLLVFSISAAPLSASMRAVLPTPNTANERFGATLDFSGDINGDGTADLAVASVSVFGQSSGHVYVYSGAELSASAPPHSTFAGTLNSNEQLGGSLDASADTNLDGFDDLLIGAVGGEYARLYPGSAGWPAPLPFVEFSDSSSAHFGTAVSLADINGDGFPEAFVGAPSTNANTGSVDLFLNRAGTFAMVPDTHLGGTVSEGEFGAALSR